MVVRIPKDVTEKEGVAEGEFVEIDVRKVKEDWFGAFPALKRFSRGEELDAHD
jgi:bifunctional DNA-binding transcriptional regulator/antitoxin component of YhaV-PrlF toxin-antitoxin module